MLEICGFDYNVRYIQIYSGFETLAEEAERVKMRFPLSVDSLERYIPKSLEADERRQSASFWTEPEDMRRMSEAATNKRSVSFKLDNIHDFKGGDWSSIGLEKVKETFFSPSQRNMIFYSILSKCKVTIPGHHLKKLSINQLIHHKIYLGYKIVDLTPDFYPPHTGPLHTDSKDNYFSNDLRAKLRAWARKINRDPVPLTNIRRYFGENVLVLIYASRSLSSSLG